MKYNMETVRTNFTGFHNQSLLTLFLKLRISIVGQLVLENIKDKSKINVGL